MKTVFCNSVAVVTANNVNISIFKPLWLAKSDIFEKEELEGNVLLSPVTVQIPTSRYQLAVLPDRIQMTINQAHEKAQSDVERVLGGLVRALPHTPYAAVGLNFLFFIVLENEALISDYTRRLFASPFANGLLDGDADDPRFGCYFSFDTLESRLRVDIKPARMSGQFPGRFGLTAGQEVIRVDFNYHYAVNSENLDAAADPSAAVCGALGNWDKALKLSEQIMAKLPE